MTSFLHLPIGLLTLLAAPTFADLPYNPARIFVTNNGSAAYIFSSQSTVSTSELHLLNLSDLVDVSNPILSPLTPNLPFLSSASAKAYIPIVTADGLNILAGDCNEGSTDTEMWHFAPDEEEVGGTWDQLSQSSTDSTFNSNFLSAGFSFSPTSSLSDTSFYIFGGMCPNGTSAADAWVEYATYSNDMLNISPNPASLALYPYCAYESKTLQVRGPPVAEAGLTITPLVPTYSNTSITSISVQQNFVLLGGHTQQAFINMSQVALFSLPEESWSFQAINQLHQEKSDLMARSSSPEVEPRSGHTAVLTSDGSKIVVFGGWVGDVSTPAEPQLAILNVGQGYGGDGDWTWTVPSTTESPLRSGQGIFGHGAAMLEGDVMLVFGGYGISGSTAQVRRQDVPSSDTQMLLYNVTSSSFMSTYTRPSSSNSPSSAENQSSSGVLRTTSQKAGLGAGLVLGFSAVAAIVAFYLFYSRRLRQKRAIREKELRELALGADRFYAGELGDGALDGRGGPYPEMRSASWNSRQEKRISASSEEFPWAPVATVGQSYHVRNGERDAERTGLLVEIPSPTRGLRRSLHARAPTNYQTNLSNGNISPFGPSPATGDIHTIAEQDEGSEGGGSLRRPKSSKNKTGNIRPESDGSDPFKDQPPPLTRSQSDVDRLQRDREVKGWVDDWETAGAAMDSGRTLQHSSSKHDQSHNNSNNSRSESPEKSDRTNSNLSERSTISSSSIQHSIFGTLSRNVSMRSASAGYMFFASAAAAMTGRATLINHPGPSGVDANSGVARASSKRSASLNFNSNASARYKAASERERSDTFSTAHTSFGPSQPGENDALLSRGASTRQGHGYEDVFETPPESPVRERQPTASTPGKKTLGWMGSMRRALTGTATAGGVRRRVEELEQKNGANPQPLMTEVDPSSSSSPRRAASASATFWRGKKGAKDWDAEPLSPTTTTTAGGGPSSSGTILRRKPVPGRAEEAALPAREDEADEWDVEAAVEKRLVQVMFTVPKEKLRVVNVDQLSLLSKSDGDPGEGGGGGQGQGHGAGEGEEGREVAVDGNKRVSTVMEEEGESPVRGLGDGDELWKGKGKGKGKEKEAR